MFFFNFFVAFRFLKFKFFRSLILIFALAIGIAVQLFVAIIIDSTQANLIKRTLGFSPHLIIKPYEDDDLNNKLKNPDLIFQKISYSFSNFKKVIALIEGPVFVSDFGGKKKINAKLISFYNLVGDDLYGISESIIFFQPNTDLNNLQDGEIVVGYSLADKLRVNVGDFLSLQNALFDYKGARVVGIFKTGNQSLDNYLLMKRETVQDFLGYKRNEYSALVFQLNDVFQSDRVKKKILSYYNEPYDFSEWKESNRQLLNGLSAQSQSSFFIQFFILVSIGVSIVSIINNKIVEKYKEIGVLKAIGMKNRNIVSVFLFMSFIIGLMSILIGVILAFFILNLFISLTKNEQGEPLFNLVVKINYVFLTLFFNISAVLFASYLSSRKVTKIDPARIIIGL